MELKNKVQALIKYANETTGKGDTLLGDAVKTLCDGYGGHEAEVEGTFMQRTTADGLSIKDASKAKAVSIKGNTWVRNQLCDTPNGSQLYAGVTITKNSNGAYSLVGTTTSGFNFFFSSQKLQVISGHKYFLGCFVNNGNTGAAFRFYLRDNTNNRQVVTVTTTTLASIGQATTTGTGFVYLNCGTTGTSIDATITPNLIDLTLWFGAGNEPTTPLEFANRLGYSSVDEIPYMDYNAGEIVGVNHLCLPPARKVEVEQYVGALRTSLTALTPIIEGNTIILEGQSTGAGQYRIHENAVDVVKGHKYLILCNGEHDTIEGSDMQLRTSNSTPCPKLARGVLSAIFEATASATNAYIMVTLVNQQYSIRLTPQLYDLTAIFGEGNEPTSVEDFYRLCPWAREYQPYGTQDRIIGFGVEERTPFVGKVNWNQICSVRSFVNEIADTSTQRNYQIQTWNNAVYQTSIVTQYVNDNSGVAHIITGTNENTTRIRLKLNGSRNDITIGYISIVYYHKYLVSLYFNKADISTIGGVNIDDIMCFDLTQMFGEGNEPTSVEEFYRRCPFARDYQPYNAGEERMIGQSSLLPINTSNFPNGLQGFLSYTKIQYRDIHTPVGDYQNVGVTILDGTENGWTVYSYREHCFSISAANVTDKDINIFEENMCLAYGWNSLNTSTTTGLGHADGVYVSISSSLIVTALDCSTLDEFKAKIAKNPIVFLWARNTPIVTPCDDHMICEAYDQGTENVVGSDAPITMTARYKDGMDVIKPNPVVIPPASLPIAHEIGSLLSYTNDVTRAGDVRMGDAIKTLCDGYDN